MVAAGIRELLPTRLDATDTEKDKATDVFASNLVKDAIKKLNEFSIEPTVSRVQREDSRLPDLPATVTDPAPSKGANRWRTIGVDYAIAVITSSSVC
jgi:hypothetical protein